MSDNVIVDNGDKSGQDTAVLLLAAAEELDLPAGVVHVDTTGPSGARFKAPQEVVDKAGLKAAKDEDEEVPERLEGPTSDFFAEHEGETKPEQSVATDERPGHTPDPLGRPNPIADGQAGEAEATKSAAAAEAEAEADKPKAAKKTTAAKKTAAKKTGA
jgi:hypothetical protein